MQKGCSRRNWMIPPTCRRCIVGQIGRWTGTGVFFVQSTLCMPAAGAHASNDVNRNEMQMMLHRHTQNGRFNFPSVLTLVMHAHVISHCLDGQRWDLQIMYQFSGDMVPSVHPSIKLTMLIPLTLDVLIALPKSKVIHSWYKGWRTDSINLHICASRAAI